MIQSNKSFLFRSQEGKNVKLQAELLKISFPTLVRVINALILPHDDDDWSGCMGGMRGASKKAQGIGSD